MVYLRYLIMANKPRIRFRGFTEDWEQRKLGDLAEIVRGASPRPISDSKWFDNNSDVGWLRISDVTAQDGRIQYLEQKISKLGQDKTRVVKTPHLLLSIAATVGKPVINYVPTGVHDGFLIFLNPKFNILYAFWWLEMFREEWNKYGQPGSQVNLNSDLVKNQVINIPNEKEQEKISSFLEALDRIITLHQCKLKKLNLAKKSLLQKLFPRNGSQIPGVRFKGFTDAWEQRKFLDLLDTQNGIRRGPFGSSLKKDSFVKKSDYVVYEQQNAIYDNYVTRYFISKEKYNELIRFNIQPGDFIMSGAGTIGRISMVPDGIKKGVFNQALIRFKVNKNSVNPLYFLKFMQSDMMQKQLTQANPGSAMTNLVPMDELKKWNVTIPSLEEQNKISNFINQIDESITLHQRKLERLQEVKKGLLQKMFV